VDGQSGRLDTHHSVNKASHLSTKSYVHVDILHLAWLHLRDTSSTNEYGERSRVIRHGIETLPTIADSPPQRQLMIRLPNVPACASPEQRGLVAA
jgi:hypothetical protein